MMKKLVLAAIASIAFFQGCSSAVLADIRDDAKNYIVVPESKGGEFSAVYASGDWIAAHEELTFTSLEDMDTSGASVSDGSNAGTVTFSGTGNRTLTLKPPASLWNASGSLITIAFSAKTAAGTVLTDSIAVRVFRGCFVSDDDGNDTLNLGTLASPMKTINAAIAKAKTLYVDHGLAAEVRVAQGTYQAACSTTVHVVNMVSGVSVKGGYRSDFRQRSTFPTDPNNLNTSIAYETILESTSSTAAGSEANPSSIACAVNISNSTEFSGFTMNTGGGGVSRAAIFCSLGSPLITDMRLYGTLLITTENVSCIVLNDSNAVIKRIYAISGKAQIISSGIYITKGTPDISSSFFCSGESGYSDFTNAIYIESGSEAIIENCSIFSIGKLTNEIVVYCGGAHPNLKSNTFNMEVDSAHIPIFFYEENASSDPLGFINNTFKVKNTCILYRDEGPIDVSISNIATTSVTSQQSEISAHPLSYWGNTRIDP